MLNPTPPDQLVDAQGRPYFLWDAEMSLEEFRLGLEDPDPEVQAYLVGKLMRQVDPEPIREALEKIGGGQRQEKAVFRQAETWRDRIADGDNSDVEAFFEHIGERDDALEREIRALGAAVSDKARKESRRRLFREIHRLLSAKAQGETSPPG